MREGHTKRNSYSLFPWQKNFQVVHRSAVGGLPLLNLSVDGSVSDTVIGHTPVKGNACPRIFQIIGIFGKFYQIILYESVDIVDDTQLGNVTIGPRRVE